MVLIILSVGDAAHLVCKQLILISSILKHEHWGSSSRLSSAVRVSVLNGIKFAPRILLKFCDSFLDDHSSGY